MKRGGAVRAHREGVLGGDVAHVGLEAVLGKLSAMRCMNRSRVTLAMIDAAAMAALVPSPRTTWRCGNSSVASRKPSVRQISGTGSSPRSARSSAWRFDRCSPRRSMSDAGTTTTQTWPAHSMTAA